MAGVHSIFHALFILMCLLLGTSVSELDNKSSLRQAMLKEHSVQPLVRVRGEDGGGRVAGGRPHHPAPDAARPAPRYMLDLYEKYKNGWLLQNSQVAANTVRSIQAEIGGGHLDILYVFMLTNSLKYNQLT